MSTLASADWGEPARRLLRSTRELEPGRPAIMHIRHTARTTITREELNRNGEFDGVALLSTPTGVQAAIDFGSALSKDRQVTLYHTYVERARETAEGIRRGVIDSGGKAEVAGVIPYRMTIDLEAQNRWLVSQKWFPQDGAYDLSRLWIARLIPTTILNHLGSSLKGMPRYQWRI